MSIRRSFLAFAFAPARAMRRDGLEKSTLGPVRVAMAACGLAALGVGGCAQSPQQLAASSQHPKEYFPSSVYGRISPRVVADGQPIPHGGGQYLVGRPYTVAGQTYYPSERRIVQVGNASWYGDAFHGRLTANGEIYDRDGFTAAHPTMPLPSYARITNLRNNYSMIVRVNDRGPYASNRIMDVSRRVAEALDYKRYGTTRIKVEYVGRASLAGSDDARLLATLRTDGPARWQGEGAPTMMADERRPAQVASLAPYAPVERPVPIVEEPPRRYREPPVLVRAPRPEPRRPTRIAARPEAVETAYRRYGVVREPPPPPPYRAYARRFPEREELVMERSSIEPRRREEGRPIRLAERDVAPHLPIRDLLPPPRYERAYDPPVRSGRTNGRAIMPPARPSELAAAHGQGRRVIEARAQRYRDD